MTENGPPIVDSAFREDVLAGLSAPIRAIPARWLYDRRGSELFEAITRLPEYYLTRTETSLLELYCGEVARIAGRDMAGQIDHHLLEQGGLGAGRIICWQLGDLVEQFRPAAVVQPARRDRRDRLGQSAQHIGAEGGISLDLWFRHFEQDGLR